MTTTLGKLRKVDLREIWKHEALDFTNWLSNPDNLNILSKELGIQINPVQTEAGVGKFKVDMLAEEEGTGRKIVIENQMESTDHDHLGKIITYASGYNAEVIIWIVKDFREEHQRAIDWLNENTDEKIGFFLIKIELWQIGDSKPAPKFVIVESPNEWAKIVKSGQSEMNETKRKQLEFWTNFKSFVSEKGKGIALRKPGAQNWYDVSIGTSDSHVQLSVNSQRNFVGCNLYISNNTDLFNYLQLRKEEIDREIGEPAEWTQARVDSLIKIKKDVSNVFSPEEASNCFNWLFEKMLLFKKVFPKHFKDFKGQTPS